MVDYAKKSRLREFSRLPDLARIDHRLVGGSKAIEEGLNRHERRKLKKNAEKAASAYRTLMKSIASSGAGYPVDQTLRNFSYEYNHRFASSGANTQPTSFNYIEPFLEAQLLQNIAPSVRVRPEKDHLFDLQDFLDFATSPESSGFELSDLRSALPEAVTHHYSCIGDVLDFTMMSADGRPFAISGFSVVRHDSRLHWYILGGELLDDDEWRERSAEDVELDIDTVPIEKRPLISELHKENLGKPNPPVPLEGTTQSMRTILTGETDLNTSRHVSRCYMSEREHSFNVINDDPDTFGPKRLSDHEEKICRSMILSIEQAGVMWNLVECLFQLPAYFAFKFKIVRDIAASEAAGLISGHVSRTGRGSSFSKYKVVSALETEGKDRSTIRSYRPPEYSVEIEGHWRRLSPTSVGSGPTGEPSLGRTWIKAHHRWRERPKRPRTIYIKSSVAAARIRADDWELDKQADIPNGGVVQADESTAVPADSSSELYVMRCPLMDGEIYKIGWTNKTAQDRADALSSQTGVPMSFVVVESWRHDDARELERGVHHLLATHRVNKRREFFKAPYETIRKVIVAEIERTNS